MIHTQPLQNRMKTRWLILLNLLSYVVLLLHPILAHPAEWQAEPGFSASLVKISDTVFTALRANQADCTVCQQFGANAQRVQPIPVTLVLTSVFQEIVVLLFILQVINPYNFPLSRAPPRVP
jgi:hypothetical protein